MAETAFEIANRLQDEYDWTPEGAERIAQIYLERSLIRRDLQSGEGF